mmetsp:Transcript_17303/g.36656  ORF Transcript_17303/g.36656 Transcript_17303/m.36656 type:complete len:242 (-) Transcript_17303:865-1590(-)
MSYLTLFSLPKLEPPCRREAGFFPSRRVFAALESTSSHASTASLMKTALPVRLDAEVASEVVGARDGATVGADAAAATANALAVVVFAALTFDSAVAASSPAAAPSLGLRFVPSVLTEARASVLAMLRAPATADVAAAGPHSVLCCCSRAGGRVVRPSCCTCRFNGCFDFDRSGRGAAIAPCKQPSCGRSRPHARGSILSIGKRSPRTPAGKLVRRACLDCGRPFSMRELVCLPPGLPPSS